MKVVINACFGGFSLSRAAVKRLAELKGRPCFFFKHPVVNGRLDIDTHVRDDGNDNDSLFWVAFDDENPDKGHSKNVGEWNEWYRQHQIDNRPQDRTDPHLIQVVEELGESANGRCAELRVVEIPDGVEWEIDEYDGNEHIAEKHRSWS